MRLTVRSRERAGEDIMDDKVERKYRTVYTIIEKPGKRPFWMKIGIAWLNHDQSWNVYLDAIPFDRKLNIREEELRPRLGGSEGHATPQQPGFDLGGIQ